MIEINLLSPDLKLKPKMLDIEAKYFVYIIPLVFSILICAHIYLAGLNLIKSQQLRALNNKWHSLEPQRKILEDFKKKYDVLSADVKIIQQLAAQRITWSEKLNKLSLNLPAGIWFNELSVTAKDFILQASTISLQKEEVALINKFMDSLKSDFSFFKDFNNLELSSVQRRQIGGYEIADFVLSGTLKKSQSRPDLTSH